MKSSTLAIFAGLLLCGPAWAAAPKCHFELDKNSVSVAWTAYKTTAKVGVNGSFKKIEVNGDAKASHLQDLMKNISVSVDRASVDTGNAGRDKTLKEFFFDKISPKPISGQFTHLDEKTHELTLKVVFNGHVESVPMHYQWGADDEFTASGEMDILKFGGQSALSSLAEKCAKLHSGKDGIAKTWSTVTLKLKGKLSSNCKPKA